MNIKNEVLIRVYVVLFLIVLVAIVIFSKAVRIQVVEGEKWRAKGDSLYLKYVPVVAERGNILAQDGSLLATSLPFFEIRMDLNSNAMDEEDFFQNVDSLAYCLATFVDNSYTVGGYRDRLIHSREAGERYLLIKKNVSYPELEQIKQFPLFNLGRYKGGLIVNRQSRRERPFRMLSHRTIGYVREGAQPVGLEGYFDEVLKGDAGRQLMLRVGPNTWMPLNDLTEIEPRAGDDIVTTIDVNLQDITQEALLRSLQYHEADHGTAIVMEVKTGAIRAIANIGRTSEGWWETYNYAVGSAIEPGSTYKLASIMALLEDGFVDLRDTLQLNKGVAQFYEEEMVDASIHNLDTATVKQAFEISSNVGIAQLVNKYYGSGENAGRFIERLKKMNLHLPTGIEIEGEASPYVKEAYSKEDQWSGTTIPWMSIGYEVTITPLQLLNFYNAVANNGTMMKPYLVSEIQHFGESKKLFRPTVVKKEIASSQTIKKARELLLSVVENGTAKKLKTSLYKFAGKTGTAQINYQKLKSKENVKYQASFAGYFPADNPVYSCIVVITDPKEHGIYGGEVAGPVFREIADKCFSSKIELHNPINIYPKPMLVNRQLPTMDIGMEKDFVTLFNALGLPFFGRSHTHWAVTKAEGDTLKLQTRNIKENVIENVLGMGLRDALFILENQGLNVTVKGAGKVVKQSVKPGMPAKGQSVLLTLQ